MKKNVFLVLCISFICFGCSAEAEWEKLKVKEDDELVRIRLNVLENDVRKIKQRLEIA